jgi:hypothetical protein
VVAIDANPLMIEPPEHGFVREIKAKWLMLVNVGISLTPGETTFWISDKSDRSSFHRAIASRDGTRHRPVSVAAVPFSDLLEEYSTPHYLKIDIEATINLRHCSHREKLPKYISVESECVGDSEALSDEQAIAMLELLRDVGYRRFKL